MRQASVIDHIGIMSKDLTPVEEIFRRLGFRHGQVSSMETGLEGEAAATNLHFMFDNSYLECICSKPGDYLSVYLHSPSALHTVVLSSSNIQKSHQLLQEAGKEVSQVMEASRPADHGENKGMARFGWLNLGQSPIPSTLLGVAEHLTPNLIYQPHRYQHENSAFRIARLVVNSGDEQRKGDFIKGFGELQEILRPAADSGHLIDEIEFCTDDELSSRYGVTQDWRRSHYAGLVFAVSDWEALKKFTDHCGYAIKEKEILVVDVCEQLGLFLGFQAK